MYTHALFPLPNTNIPLSLEGMLSKNLTSLLCTIFIFSSLLLFYISTTSIINNPILKFINKNFTTTTSSSSSPSPPPPPLEVEDDEELFQLAAQVNPNSQFNVPNKIAFMFLTTTPLPLAPLWEAFFLQKNQNQNQNRNQSEQNHHPLFNIYIPADPSFTYNPPFGGSFTNRVIPYAKPTQRGSPSLISAARRLLSHALLHDSSNAYFILLSTSCIPLHSFNYIYNFLTIKSNNMSFIEILKDEPDYYNRYISRGSSDVMLPEIPFEKFRVGSQFFILNRRHGRLVVEDKLRIWSKFKLPCLKPKTCYPEENYFSTLLSMEDPGGCVPATLTHVDWSRRNGGHPYGYKKSEVEPQLINSLRQVKIRYGNGGGGVVTSQVNHTFLFARKFSASCLEPLMSITSDVIFRN